MKTITALKRARKLLEKPERWTQDSPARDKDGFICDSSDRHAVSFCAIGSVAKFVHKYSEVAALAEKALESCLPKGWGFVSSYNDHPRRTHKQILALFDRAIRKLERVDK